MRFLILFLLIIASSNFSFSQTSLGLKAGLNYGTFNFPIEYITVADNNYRPGFYVGENSNIRLNEKFFFLFELMYSEKGTEGEPGKAFHEKLIMHYANMPILFNYILNKRINLYLGPDIGILLDANIETPTGTVDANEYLQTFDLGLAMGFSIDLIKGLYLDARYVEGLTRLHEGLFRKEEADHDKSGRNRSVQVGFGYRIFQN